VDDPPATLDRAEPSGLREHLAWLFPGSRIRSVERLTPDAAARTTVMKAIGYGVPLKVTLEGPDGVRLLVFRTASPNDFGHDRRSDRAQQMLLAFDTFGGIPRHAKALDVGALTREGSLVSLRETGEFYLLTDYLPGRLYADDLRRLATEGEVRDEDRRRANVLARYLAALHAEKGGRTAVYRRAIRDLLGQGEGIFGIVDAFLPDVPSAPPERLRGIESLCVEWRWRLRSAESRLARTHGDFHPFNVLFDDSGELALLDTSRGSRGEPADDVTSMAINYFFAALESPEVWPRALGPLWNAFWSEYVRASGDSGIFDAAAPFLAWRGLVLACPTWYPALQAPARDRLLGFIEDALRRPRFDPGAAHAFFP
jgi:Phosphotransferase enzyme family